MSTKGAAVAVEEEHKKSLRRSWKTSGPVAKLTCVFSGIAAASTLVYALLAGWQLSVLGGQLGEMRRAGIFAQGSFRVSQRPYLLPETVSFDVSPQPSKEIGLTVMIKNSGRTPALDVSVAMKMFDAQGKAVTGRNTVLPGNVIASDHTAAEHYLVTFTEDLSLFNQTRQALTLKGVITYSDIFKQSHQTTFCAYYDGIEKIFKTCPDGNDLDR